MTSLRLLSASVAAVVLFQLIPAASGQENEKAELYASFGGLRAEGSKDWNFAYVVGGTYDAFKKPEFPLAFEFFESVKNESSSSSAVDFFGGGMRFGGKVQPLFGSITGGFAKFVSRYSYWTGSQYAVAEQTLTKAAVSFTGGANIPLGADYKWGVRVEARGIKVQDVQPWMYQVGGGMFYRW